MLYPSIINQETQSATYTSPLWVQEQQDYPSSVTFTPDLPESQDFEMPEGSVVTWRYLPESEMSFSKIKQLRLIKMTPLDVGRITKRNFLFRLPVTRHKFVAAHWWDTKFISGKPYADYGGAVYAYNSHHVASATWVEQYDPVRLHASFSLPEYRVEIEDPSSMLNAVSAEAVASADSTLDILTEAAEFPATLKMIIDLLKAAVKPVKSIKNLIKRYNIARKKGKTHQEALDDLSSEWLQYRYGIMPIVYSIRDTLELLDQQAVEFKTDRARDSIPLVSSSPPQSDCFYETLTGSITCRAVAKTRYGNTDLRLLDQLSINPFLTAWELVPFSFVIDWFINVGNVIASHTLALGDMATQRSFCRSIRKRYTLSERARISTTTNSHYHEPYVHSTGVTFCDGWDYPPVTSQVDAIVQSTEYDTYERTLFNPSDVELSFSPSLSWMREMDGIALTLRKLIKMMS